MKIPHCFQVNSVLSHLKGYAVIASSAALCLRVRRRTTRLGRDTAAVTVIHPCMSVDFYFTTLRPLMTYMPLGKERKASLNVVFLRIRHPLIL